MLWFCMGSHCEGQGCETRKRPKACCSLGTWCPWHHFHYHFTKWPWLSQFGGPTADPTSMGIRQTVEWTFWYIPEELKLNSPTCETKTSHHKKMQRLLGRGQYSPLWRSIISRTKPEWNTLRLPLQPRATLLPPSSLGWHPNTSAISSRRTPSCLYICIFFWGRG